MGLLPWVVERRYVADTRKVYFGSLLGKLIRRVLLWKMVKRSRSAAAVEFGRAS